MGRAPDKIFYKLLLHLLIFHHVFCTEKMRFWFFILWDFLTRGWADWFSATHRSWGSLRGSCACWDFSAVFFWVWYCCLHRRQYQPRIQICITDSWSRNWILQTEQEGNWLSVFGRTGSFNLLKWVVDVCRYGQELPATFDSKIIILAIISPLQIHNMSIFSQQFVRLVFAWFWAYIKPRMDQDNQRQ